MPVRKRDNIQYDVILNIGLYSLWLLRMSVHHSDMLPKPVHVFLFQCLTELVAVLELQPNTSPECLIVLRELLNARWN